MPQVLLINGQPRDIDRKFSDGGKPAIYSMERGHRILIEAETPAAPDVYQKGDFFFFGDLSPVTKEGDVQHLPEKYKAEALKQIKRLQAGGPKAAKALKSKHNPERIRKGVVRGAPGAGFLASRPKSTRRMSELMPEGAEAE